MSHKFAIKRRCGLNFLHGLRRFQDGVDDHGFGLAVQVFQDVEGGGWGEGVEVREDPARGARCGDGRLNGGADLEFVGVDGFEDLEFVLSQGCIF